jgi:hypothetical protein
MPQPTKCVIDMNCYEVASFYITYPPKFS